MPHSRIYLELAEYIVGQGPPLRRVMTRQSLHYARVQLLVRQHLLLKRAMLDQLADMHDFPVPEGMVEMEFNQIWQDFETSLKQDGKTLETADKPEEELRTEYRDIAVRRVRLGLLLSNIGDTNEITVTAEELNRAIMMEAQRFPGQERRVFEFYQKNPDAMQQVRAPIFEEKVMDFILDKAEVTEKEVDRETLLSDPDEDAAADSK